MSSLSPAYKEIKRLRSTGRCAQALSILRTRPPASDDDAFEAVVCLFVCGDLQSAVNVCDTRPWKKSWAAAIAAALARSLRDGDREHALEAARHALRAGDAPLDAVAVYLLLLQQSGRIDEAAAYIARHLQEPPAGETFLLTIIAEICAARADWREAYRAASAVLAADPDDYRALIVQSIVNFEVGNFHEALGNAIRASVLHKGSAPAVLQLMRCRNKLGNHYAALAAFDTLAQGATVSAEMHVELGRAYQGLRETERALAEYRAALAADSDSLDALRALVAIHGFRGDTDALDALVREHRARIEADIECMCSLALEAVNRDALDEAAERFRTTLAIAQRSGEALRELPWPVPEPRLRHDREQLELLERRGRLDASGQGALAVMSRYGGADAPDGGYAPEGKAGEALKSALSSMPYVPELPACEQPLGENDFEAIERQYLSERLVVIDNFLSPEALALLRRYCEEATIWKLNYNRGYVGALIAQGFSPRVLLAAAAALRRAMPHVLGDHPLMQAWAFKYDQRLEGIDMHADFAEVNANFWITPDEACADPSVGGMVVYDVPVPKHWTFFEYNNESEKLAAYVKVHGAKAIRIPYRANRCVLFDSSLIHITDRIDFKPGYENRRVNVTLLYGQPRNVL